MGVSEKTKFKDLPIGWLHAKKVDVAEIYAEYISDSEWWEERNSFNMMSVFFVFNFFIPIKPQQPL